MVEASENSQKPPSAAELAQAKRLEAMLAAAANDEDEDYNLEEDDEDIDGESNSMEMDKQRRLLA